MSTQLKQLRKSMNLTQQQVADRLGITRQAYNHYETQRRSPDTKTLMKLADLYSCTIDRLVGYEPYARPHSPQMSAVPILGSVRAGNDHLVSEEYEGYEYVDVKNPEEYFCLNIIGDSMEPQILEGDLALVHKQSTIASGDLAVVLIGDEEATIKRVFKAGKDLVLQPFNSSYPVRVFGHKEQNELRILGKVVRTSRNW